MHLKFPRENISRGVYSLPCYPRLYFHLQNNFFIPAQQFNPGLEVATVTVTNVTNIFTMVTKTSGVSFIVARKNSLPSPLNNTALYYSSPFLCYFKLLFSPDKIKSHNARCFLFLCEHHHLLLWANVLKWISDVGFSCSVRIGLFLLI